MDIIKSLVHPSVKHWAALRKVSDYRKERSTVIVQGVKMVRELPEGIEVLVIGAIARAYFPATMPGAKRVLVTEEVMDKIWGVKHPEGVFAEVKRPEHTLSELMKCHSILVLDGIADPGNMGTLIRTAHALGWGGILLTGEGVDPYNDKALRASKGATFRIPIVVGSYTDLEVLVKEGKFTPVVADLSGKPPEDFIDTIRPCLILGSESHGPSPVVKRMGPAVTVPMVSGFDSINVAVAGGILMYFMAVRSE